MISLARRHWSGDVAGWLVRTICTLRHLVLAVKTEVEAVPEAFGKGRSPVRFHFFGFLEHSSRKSWEIWIHGEMQWELANIDLELSQRFVYICSRARLLWKLHYFNRIVFEGVFICKKSVHYSRTIRPLNKAPIDRYLSSRPRNQIRAEAPFPSQASLLNHHQALHNQWARNYC